MNVLTARLFAEEVIDASSATWEDVTEELNSAESVKEKTNYFVQYLLSQRDVVFNFLKTLLIAVIVLIIGLRLIKFFIKLTERVLTRRSIDLIMKKFILSAAKVVYYLALVFIIAWILGIGATVVAVVASAGLAIGLALQGSLSNLAGGVLILALKPFQIGEYISVADTEGTVEDIDIFYTHLATTDNKKVIVPNGTITNSTITNTTVAPKRMLILDFMVPYETDIEGLRAKLLAVMEKNEFLMQEEPKSVVVNKLSPIKVQMQLKAWVPTKNYWEARYELFEQLKDAVEGLEEVETKEKEITADDSEKTDVFNG